MSDDTTLLPGLPGGEPLDEYLDVEIPMLPKQLTMLSWDTKFAAARGGVGSGKSVAWAYWALIGMEEFPEATHVVAGADYEQLRRGFFSTFVGLLDNLGYVEGVDYKYRELPTPMVVLLWNGARLRSISVKIAERMRSLEVQRLVVEEPQTWYNGERVFETLIGRVRHSSRTAVLYPSLKVQVRISFNPPPKGHWLYNLVEKRWKKAGYPSCQLSVRDNYLMRDVEEYIAGLEATMSPDRIPVEIDGEYGRNAGTVYLSFDDDRNAPEGRILPDSRMPPLAYDWRRPLLWSLDFNVGKMCSSISQKHVLPTRTEWRAPAPGYAPRAVEVPVIEGVQQSCIYVIGEIVLRNAGVPNVIAEFLRVWGERARKSGVILYGDCNGGARSQSIDSNAAATSHWETIIESLVAYGITVDARIMRSNPGILNRLHELNAQAYVARIRADIPHGGPGLFLDRDECPDHVDDLRLVCYKPGTNDVDKKDPERTHSTDELGYLVYYERKVDAGDAGEIEMRDYSAFMGR